MIVGGWKDSLQFKKGRGSVFRTAPLRLPLRVSVRCGKGCTAKFWGYSEKTMKLRKMGKLKKRKRENEKTSIPIAEDRSFCHFAFGCPGVFCPLFYRRIPEVWMTSIEKTVLPDGERIRAIG